MATAAAAKKTDEPEETGTALVAGGGAPLPAHLAGIEADAGDGLSRDAADNIVPLLYVLQSNSPQVNQRGPDAIKGAKPGDLWIKGSSEAVDGDVGLIVQPCAFKKDWVEWIPRKAGGGYVGRHDNCPPGAVEKKDEEGRARLTLPDGHEINETRYHFVMASGAPVVIPFSSTGHTVSRDWMYKMNAVKLPNKLAAPSYACLWRLTTKMRSNKSGDWFVIVPELVGWVEDVADYELGKSFAATVKSGAVTADTEDQAAAGGTPRHDPETGEIKGEEVPF